MTYTTESGFAVVPVVGSYRRACGGYCVDVRCSDPRTTVTDWTENAANVRDENGQAYREVNGRPVVSE